MPAVVDQTRKTMERICQMRPRRREDGRPGKGGGRCLFWFSIGWLSGVVADPSTGSDAWLVGVMGRGRSEDGRKANGGWGAKNGERGTGNGERWGGMQF